MNEIANGVLRGGWPLIAGWILPTGINLTVFGIFLFPVLRQSRTVDALANAPLTQQSIAVLVGAVVIGLLANALQTPLFRVLEGYLGWPPRLSVWGCARQARYRQQLRDRLTAVRLLHKETRGELSADETAQLAALRDDRKLTRVLARDTRLSAPKRGLLRERLGRFPTLEDQIAPTRLGNAIRRLEEYGYERYRLDSQVFWYELNAVAPEQAREAVVNSRIGVDFAVCMLYGNLGLAVAAVGVQAGRLEFSPLLTVLATLLVALLPAWYRLALGGTDDWAVATRALVNLGRKPLAESLGLELPPTIDEERKMWAVLSKLVRLGYNVKAAELDPYRAGRLVEPAGGGAVRPVSDLR